MFDWGKYATCGTWHKQIPWLYQWQDHWKLLIKFIGWFYAKEGRMQGNDSRIYTMILEYSQQQGRKAPS